MLSDYLKFKPKYADKLMELLDKEECEEVKGEATVAFHKYIFTDMMEEFKKRINIDEFDKKYDFFVEYRESIRNQIIAIGIVLDPRIYYPVMDLLMEIVDKVEKEVYELAYSDGLKRVDEGKAQQSIAKIDFYVDIPEKFIEQHNHKAVCKKKDVGDLVKAGLCCALCNYYISGKCYNLACPESELPEVEPWQVCEYISFDEEKYCGYYFDGNTLIQRNTRKEKKNFAQIASEIIDKMENSMLDNEKFISFIKEEIPDVYRKLRQEYRKRKENIR